jgi:hypothetical protein
MEEEPPKEIERKRDEYRAALIGVVITVLVGGGVLWLMNVL